MRMPLEGIRVIDWTIWQQGPVASMMLADLGADVIKVEERTGGDPGRGVLRAQGVDLSGRPNFYFEANNRNKRSLTVDLKKPEGVAIVRELAAGADVFVQNFRQGVAERLGLDGATLRADNARLIYASANGFGPRGAESTSPSMDYLGIARSGIMLGFGDPDQPPLNVAGASADQMGAVILAYGVVVALLARERSGQGQEVHASQLGSMAWLQGLSLAARLMLGGSLPRVPRKYANNPLWNHYECGDGQWIAFAMVQPDRYWKRLCGVLEIPEAADDPRFTDIQQRMMNCGECIALLDAALAKRSRPEWIERLRTGGDFIFTIVNSVNDLPDDPQMRANDYITTFAHPSFGPTEVVGLPVHLSATPGAIRLPAPEFGQHTEEILTEVLGYSWERVGALKELEVI